MGLFRGAKFLVMGIMLVFTCASARAETPSVASCPEGGMYAMTRQGCVEGRIADGAREFKGIPFAAPPVDELRWKAPVLPASRDKILPAFEFGPRCAQPAKNQKGLPLQSEDCLYLNIWAPATPSRKGPLPVIVFLHGGGNTIGSAGDRAGAGNIYVYDGQTLAGRGDVIVVTIQFRLNVFGFLARSALAAESGRNASGNYGLMDQIAALKWVKDTIGFFGGDPSRVVLSGASSGATDACALVASPLAKGLFFAAILESGSCHVQSSAAMEAWSAQVVKDAGCAGAANEIACMRKLPASDLVKGISQDTAEFGGKIVAGPGPTVDGYVLPQSPDKALETGDYNHVPIMVGANAQETASSVFKIPLSVPSDQYENIVHDVFGSDAYGVLSLYPPDAFSTPRAALVAATTDSQFICPARRYLRSLARSQRQPVFGYEYTHVMGEQARFLGAAHGMELYYVFQAMDRVRSGYTPTDSDLALEKNFLGYWMRFAANGNPNGDGLSLWPEFDPASDSYLLLDQPPQAATGFGRSRCDFWDKAVKSGGD